jgi:hypothetical protein
LISEKSAEVEVTQGSDGQLMQRQDSRAVKRSLDLTSPAHEERNIFFFLLFLQEESSRILEIASANAYE